MQFQETLHKFILDELMEEMDETELSAEDNLLLSGLISSLDIFRLINFIRDTFEIQVHPQDVTIENFGTINQIAAYLQRQNGS